MDSKAGELRNSYKAEPIFSRLLQRFTTREFLELASQYDLPKSAVARVLKSAIGIRISKIEKVCTN